ncbi:hypothetical protein Bhyg_07326, partial [Pseudolycoriella hygida]
MRKDYRSPYGNYVAEMLPTLPNHYKNPLPSYRQNNRRQFRRFFTSIKRNFELPRFIAEPPSNTFASKSFEELAFKYWNRQKYPMFEPIPGQILYPPSVPQFKSIPLNELSQLRSRKDDDEAFRRDNKNIQTFQSTIYPFYEHESITKKSSTKQSNVRDELDITTPDVSMVIEPTTIKVSSTTSGIKANTKHSTIKPSVHYVYSVPVNRSTYYFSNDFEKELPRKVVIETPPKKSMGDNQLSFDANGMISTKLISNRFLEYTTSGYSNFVTIRPIIDRPDSDTTESIKSNNILKPNDGIKIIPLLRSTDGELDSRKRTYTANKAGFKNIPHTSTKKTTLKPIIYTLSSLLLDTDNQSTSHQLSKLGQYVDHHLSSTIINDRVGKPQYTEQPAEAVRSTDGPTTNGNQIYENKNYSGINDGDEWNDGNSYSNSRALNRYGRVNVEPNMEWIMVSKSSLKESKFSDTVKNSRSQRLMSSSYRDFVVPMTMKEMPK